MSDVIDKVRKLLRLAQSSNAHEAALAAAKAQQFIDEHNLSAALLAVDAPDGEQASDEPIEDFARKDAPLDRRARLDRWAVVLAGAISRANGCRIYLIGSDIALVGRPSDADTVRYLYEYLSREVERLCEQDGKGCGRTWRNNYRLGVVDTIANKLHEQRRAFAREQRRLVEATGDSQALVRVDKALARVEARTDEVSAWMKSNLKLYSIGGSSARRDHGAREAGRKAGQSIVINRAKGRLSA